MFIVSTTCILNSIQYTLTPGLFVFQTILCRLSIHSSFTLQPSGVHVHGQARRGVSRWLAAWCWHNHPRPQGFITIMFTTCCVLTKIVQEKLAYFKKQGDLWRLGLEALVVKFYWTVCDPYCVTKQHLFISSSYQMHLKGTYFSSLI